MAQACKPSAVADTYDVASGVDAIRRGASAIASGMWEVAKGVAIAGAGLAAAVSEESGFSHRKRAPCCAPVVVPLPPVGIPFRTGEAVPQGLVQAPIMTSFCQVPVIDHRHPFTSNK